MDHQQREKEAEAVGELALKAVRAFLEGRASIVVKTGNTGAAGGGSMAGGFSISFKMGEGAGK